MMDYFTSFYLFTKIEWKMSSLFKDYTIDN